ncbi:uncharacterized protein TNCV_1999231 [Trichonephila clavipes]|nr:uncharacterized protein TNCV_1999231 [Trichonephila clavipes]
MQSTSVDVFMNGLYISRIYQFALRKSGSQLFKFPLRIDHIYSRNVLTNKLNGLQPEDLLLLRGDQEVTGLLKFSNVTADNVLAESINSIPVESLVTAGSHQQIKELKSISHFSSRVIDVHGKTNGEFLREFVKRIVLIFGDSELKRKYTLTSPVEITGDIFLTGLINDYINLDQLDLHSVRKHTEQALKGSFVFTSPHAVFGNLDVKGYINGIDINQLMTLSTDQNVQSNIVFHELLTINGSLVVDYVNGIDLDKMAVMKTGSHIVAGFVTFSRPLTADSINMKDNVVLDDVDPSLMLQDIVNHVEGVAEMNEVSFHNVIVLGHIIATEGINGIQISELPTTIWLKTSNQVSCIVSNSVRCYIDK